jgi:hypothetical protein
MALVSFCLALIASSGASAALASQEQPPASAPPNEATAPATPEPKPETPVLQNTGKPMLLPFRCSDEDVHWAGMTCSEEEPCPVYLELTALEVVGNKIFAAGNLHSATTTLYTVLLASDDAGQTWREGHARLRGSSLDHIQFVDFENGWISGQVVAPVAQDPFFLITSDGGKSWRHHAIFSEGRTGSIQQFWFDSKSTGKMLLDRSQSGETGSRFELYESPNGGETWMIREAGDKPMQVRRVAAPENSDTRLRPDGPSKSFRIEKRSGGRWASIAAFAVRVGECKPALAPLQEPAEPAATETAEPAEPAELPARPTAKPPSLKRKK